MGLSSTAVPAGQFAPTHWTVILQAKGETARAQVALEQLCQTYWPPVYAFIRRQGHNPHDAEDLTQEFFTRLLHKDYLDGVDRAKGKFRSFLLAAVKNFLANEWHKANAIKRGGGQKVISIDARAAESSCCIDLPHELTADKVFERRWATMLLEVTLARLREEYVVAGKGETFEALKATLTGERGSIGYAEIASNLKTTEGNIKVAVHRLRGRYRDLLREEISNTVTAASDVDEELRNLFAVLSS
jgi:RNA polymerase sigma-70 factor (ECF subfamily)